MESSGDWKAVLRELDAAEGRAAATTAASTSAAVAPRAEPMTVYMYTACITTMSKCKRWREALEVLDRMMAAAEEEGGGGELTPNVNTMSAVITACGRCGQGKAALEVCVCMCVWFFFLTGQFIFWGSCRRDDPNTAMFDTAILSSVG